MFCFPQHDHHSSTRLLHSFRSHRSLRASAQKQRSDSPEDDVALEMPHPRYFSHGHQRNPSDAPTVSTTTTTGRSSTDSSRPSTSGGRSNRSDSFSSVEWDPLRLHPPLAPAPRLHQERSLPSFNQHLQMRQSTVPVQAVPTPSRHAYTRSAPPALVIYEGFDFGFGEKSLSSTPSSSTASTPELGSGSFRRPVPPGGMDGPDYFIKRGGWKRRGIVFSAAERAVEEPGCEDVFDLDC